MKNSIEDLVTLNLIVEKLNQAVNVQDVLKATLSDLIALMRLETGWIFLVDPDSQDNWAGKGYSLAAYQNLPPALAVDDPEAWNKGCDCQGLCNTGKLTEAYNEIRCSRLAESTGERQGSSVHASTPLKAGDKLLGILNVAGPDWDVFTAQALALLYLLIPYLFC